jgi:hypothetical protein
MPVEVGGLQQGYKCYFSLPWGRLGLVGGVGVAFGPVGVIIFSTEAFRWSCILWMSKHFANLEMTKAAARNDCTKVQTRTNGSESQKQSLKIRIRKNKFIFGVPNARLI